MPACCEGQFIAKGDWGSAVFGRHHRYPSPNHLILFSGKHACWTRQIRATVLGTLSQNIPPLLILLILMFYMSNTNLILPPASLPPSCSSVQEFLPRRPLPKVRLHFFCDFKSLLCFVLSSRFLSLTLTNLGRQARTGQNSDIRQTSSHAGSTRGALRDKTEVPVSGQQSLRRLAINNATGQSCELLNTEFGD